MALTFERVNIWGGGWVTGFVSHADGSKFARTDVGGAYRLDSGVWTQMLRTDTVPAADQAVGIQCESLTAAPSDSSRLYLTVGGDLGTNGRLLYSTDKGLSWTASAKNFKIDGNAAYRFGTERLAVDPSNPDVVYHGTRSEGLWYSVDGGATFTQITSVPAVALGGTNYGHNCVLVDPSSPIVGGRHQTITVFVPGVGLSRTTDGGTTWATIKASTSHFGQDVVRASDGASYWIANSGASPWTKGVWKVATDGTVTDITPDVNGTMGSIAVDPNDPQRLVLGRDGVRSGKIWLSTNGGTTWTPKNIAINNGAPNAVWPTQSDLINWMSTGHLRFDPSGTLWFSEGMGVWKTTDLADSEITWQFASQGIEELVSTDIYKPPAKPLLTAAWDRGVHRHPTPSTGGAELPLTGQFGSAWDFGVSPTDPLFVAYILDDHMDASGVSNPHRKMSGWSADGGTTFNRFGSLVADTHPADLMFGNIVVSANNNDNLVWLASNTLDAIRLYYSTDRGATWVASTVNGALAGEHGHSAHYLRAKHLLADPATAGTFYLITNNNANGDPRLYKSTDSGATWNLLADHTNGLGGAGWYDFRYNPKIRAVPGTASTFIVAPGHTSSSGRPFWKSTDGGATWTAKNGVLKAHDIVFGAPLEGQTNPTAYTYGHVADDYGIYSSTDLGETWTKQTDQPLNLYDSVTALAADSETPERLYVGFAGTGFAMSSTETTQMPTASDVRIALVNYLGDLRFSTPVKRKATSGGTDPAPEFTLVKYADSSRSNPSVLAGSTVAGDIYVGAGPSDRIDYCEFYLDDDFRRGDQTIPHDFAGGTTTANPYSTLGLGTTAAPADHTIRCEIDWTDSAGLAQHSTVTATFTVANPVDAGETPVSTSLLFGALVAGGTKPTGTGGPGGFPDYERWLGGRKVMVSKSNFNRKATSWGSFVQGVGLENWAPWAAGDPARRCVFNVQPFPGRDGGLDSITSLAACSRGENNTHYTSIANTFANHFGGQSNIVYICCMHELNGNWYPWGGRANNPTRDQQQISTFRHMVTTMRARFDALGLTQFRFGWITANGPALNVAARAEDVWPGVDYVDIMGPNIYDRLGNSNLPQIDRWAAIMEKNTYGVRWHRDWAKAHNLPMACTEWGCDSEQGGDNPHFIEQSTAFFTDPANNYEVLQYFEIDEVAGGAETGGGSRIRLSYNGTDSPYLPLAAAKFRSLWSL